MPQPRLTYTKAKAQEPKVLRYPTKMLFNAEKDLCYNMGLLESEPKLLESLFKIKKLSTRDKLQLTEEDCQNWKQENNSCCNDKFKYPNGAH